MKIVDDLKFDGKMVEVGTICIPEKEKEEKNVYDKKSDDNIEICMIDNKRFKIETQTRKSDKKPIMQRFLFDLLIEVNGAIRKTTIYGENMLPGYNKNIRIKKDGAESAETISVDLDSAEDYANECTNAKFIQLLDEKDTLEILIKEYKKNKKLSVVPKEKLAELESKSKKALRFVTNTAMIRFLCAHADKIQGKKVKLEMGAGFNKYKSDISVRSGFLNSLRAVDEDSIDMAVANMPVWFLKNVYDNVINNKDGKLNVMLPFQTKIGDDYVMKVIENSSLIGIDKETKSLPDEIYTEYMTAISQENPNPHMRMVCLELSKGSEVDGDIVLSPAENIKFGYLPEEKKIEFLAKKKAAKGTRGYAKEAASLFSSEPTAEPFTIRPSDVFSENEKVTVETREEDKIDVSIDELNIDMGGM